MILKRHHQKAHIQITQTAKDYLKAELDRLFEQNGYDEYFGVAEPPVRSVLSRKSLFLYLSKRINGILKIYSTMNANAMDIGQTQSGLL